MSRPRQYATDAERQAAHRQRLKATTLVVHREPFLRMEQAVDTLYQAVHRAARHHHPLVPRLLRGTPLETLEAVVDWLTTDLLTAVPAAEDSKM